MMWGESGDRRVSSEAFAVTQIYKTEPKGKCDRPYKATVPEHSNAFESPGHCVKMHILMQEVQVQDAAFPPLVYKGIEGLFRKLLTSRRCVPTSYGESYRCS